MKFIKRFLPRNIWQLAVMLFPILIDGVDFLLYEKINQWLLSLMSTPSVKSLSAMLFIYFLFIVCIIIIEMLVPDIRLKQVKVAFAVKDDNGYTSGDESLKITWPEILFFYPSIGFGVIMLILIFNTLGLTSRNSPFSENQQYGIIWIAIILFFVHFTAIFKKMKPRFKSTAPAYLAVYAPAVIICVLVINLSVAAWQFLLGDPSMQPMSSREGKLLDWFFAWPIFILFFSSPRFVFMNKNFNWLSLISALSIIGYFVWRSLDYVKII